jgi:MFS family permease
MASAQNIQPEDPQLKRPAERASSNNTTDKAEVKVETAADSDATNPRRSLRFWAVFISLCSISFISALDATIVSTALPTISRDIGGENDYAWIANCFTIASTAPQPLFAQISNIFGRRNPMLVALTIFGLGSGIAGGARNVAMLIAGRSIQGIGNVPSFPLGPTQLLHSFTPPLLTPSPTLRSPPNPRH